MHQPSITIGVCLRSKYHNGLHDYADCVRRLYDAGYRTLDFAFVMQNMSTYILRGDDWQQKMDEICNLSAKLGITWSQSHLPYVNETMFQADANFRKPGYQEYFDECMRRAYLASAMLGVRYATLHPLSFPEFNYETQAQQDANHAYFDQFIDLGIKHGVGTAYENMLPSLNRAYPDRYCTHYEQLISLIDSYNDPMVAACWDTGHANQMNFDQQRALRAMGHRVKNLHLNDNHYGTRDEHLQPFMGYIDWYKVIETLAEIGYDGDITYETNQVGIKYPYGELQEHALRMTYENGCLITKLFLEAKAKLESNK